MPFPLKTLVAYYADSLPVELVERIVISAAQNDLKSTAILARCCKTFHEWCTPELYKCIIMTKKQQHSALKRTIQDKPEYAALIQTIILEVTSSPAQLGDLLQSCHSLKHIAVLEPLVNDRKDYDPIFPMPQEVVLSGPPFPEHADWSKVEYLYFGETCPPLRPLFSKWMNTKFIICTFRRQEQMYLLIRFLLIFLSLQDILDRVPNVVILLTGNEVSRNDLLRENSELKKPPFQVVYLSDEDFTLFWDDIRQGTASLEVIITRVTKEALRGMVSQDAQEEDSEKKHEYIDSDEEDSMVASSDDEISIDTPLIYPGEVSAYQHNTPPANLE